MTEVSDLLVEIPPVPEDGLITRAARRLGYEPEDFADRMTMQVQAVWLDDKGTEIGKVVPCQKLTGHLGAYPSDVLIIGKMPTQEESNKTVLGCGEPGRLWRDYFATQGLDIREWMIVNTCWFRVPEFMLGSGGRLKSDVLKENIPLLARVLNIVHPRYILFFGSEAFQVGIKLLAPEKAKVLKFSEVQGSILDLPNGIKAVCATSPVTVLKDPDQWDNLERDLRIFTDLVKSDSRPSRPSPEITYVDTKEQLLQLLSRLTPFQLFSLDLEWGGNHQIRTIQLSWAPNTAAVIILARPDPEPGWGRINTELGSDLEWTMGMVKRLLGRPGVRLLGHNLRGDIRVLRKAGVDLFPQFLNGGADTMLMHHEFYETAEHQLELVASVILGMDRYDRPLREWLNAQRGKKKLVQAFGYDPIPDEILLPYAAMDAIAVFELFPVFQQMLEKKPGLYKHYYESVHPANEPLLEMEEIGIRIDENRLKEMSTLFVEKREDLRGRLQEILDWKPTVRTVTKRVRGKEVVVEEPVAGFNPDSPDQVKEVLFNRFKVKNKQPVRVSPENVKLLGLTPVKATDDTPWEEVVSAKKEHLYQPSTDAESLGILAKEHPIANLLRQYRFVAQIVKTFVGEGEEDEAGDVEWEKGYGQAIEADGRVHTTFRQTLETGRYATSPNLQNCPAKQEKELMKIFQVPALKEPGKLVIDPRYRIVRSMFIAAPGCVFIEADWNQAELWTLGALAQDEEFLHVLATSDVHTVMMQTMFKDIVYEGRKLGDIPLDELVELKETSKIIKSYRTGAKTVVFGSITPFSLLIDW